jgi:hypothetical protein
MLGRSSCSGRASRTTHGTAATYCQGRLERSLILPRVDLRAFFAKRVVYFAAHPANAAFARTLFRFQVFEEQPKHREIDCEERDFERNHRPSFHTQRPCTATTDFQGRVFTLAEALQSDEWLAKIVGFRSRPPLRVVPLNPRHCNEKLNSSVRIRSNFWSDGPVWAQSGTSGAAG